MIIPMPNQTWVTGGVVLFADVMPLTASDESRQNTKAGERSWIGNFKFER